MNWRLFVGAPIDGNVPECKHLIGNRHYAAQRFTNAGYANCHTLAFISTGCPILAKLDGLVLNTPIPKGVANPFMRQQADRTG
jgi:hypothetical protein